METISTNVHTSVLGSIYMQEINKSLSIERERRYVYLTLQIQNQQSSKLNSYH